MLSYCPTRLRPLANRVICTHTHTHTHTGAHTSRHKHISLPAHAPAGKLSDEEQELLGDALSLLAYDQPESAPAGHLLGQVRRVH